MVFVSPPSQVRIPPRLRASVRTVDELPKKYTALGTPADSIAPSGTTSQAAASARYFRDNLVSHRLKR